MAPRRPEAGEEPPRTSHLGWVLSVPDTHQKTVLAALEKERAIRTLTLATEDEAAARIRMQIDSMPQEIDACQGYLFRQLELIEHRVVCTLGNFATKLLSGKPQGITRVHGQPQEVASLRAWPPGRSWRSCRRRSCTTGRFAWPSAAWTWGSCGA